MGFWTSLLCCSLAVLAASSQQDDEQSDTFANDNLKTALDAVSRRERDLTSPEPGYYGLSAYRYPKANPDENPFSSEGKDFSEDGQPENIGYGFQKSMASSSAPGRFASQLSRDIDSASDSRQLEELALEIFEMGLKVDDDDDKQYFPSINDEEKRSVFRERDMPGHAPSTKNVVNKRKRGSTIGMIPSLFRERAHLSDDNEGKRRRFSEHGNRRWEQNDVENNDEEEEEYKELIGSLLDKYAESNRNAAEIDKLSEKELEELLEYLGENGISKEDFDGVRGEVEKRYGGNNGYGAGYDFFNNGAAMSGGFGYKKRSKQRLDDGDASSDAFLYSLKFVSPEHNREAVEQLREHDGLDLSDESDVDIMKLGLKYNNDNGRQHAVAWFPDVDNEEEEYENNDNHQVLLPAHDFKSAKYQDIPSDLLLPERQIDKKFLYDRALLKRKRFPVTKRSSNYYASPPLLHHHAGGERKKKNAPEIHATDPKVASELSQIFSSPSNENSNENVKIVPQIIGNHVVNKQKAIPIAITKVQSTSTTTEAALYEQHNQSVIEDRPNEEEIELPVTMSRLEIPIEVKKKSVDWSDYFGLDRRRKKTAPRIGPSNSAVNGDWILNQYYKTLALSANPNKHISPHHINNEMKRKKAVVVQPFDTRLFDADIFERNQVKKSRASEGEDPRIENMDSKLRNLEDLIVNEAVKYTGSHEGTTDSKEIQEVKDKVMTRLTAAYNLEKMRKALGEFKSSLSAQKESKYNPMAQRKEYEDKRKRVAIKKERAEAYEEKRTRGEKKRSNEEFIDTSFGGERNEESFGQFLDRSMFGAMSEGDMGGRVSSSGQNELECAILPNIAKKCRAIETGSGDHELTFLPICALHQICYLCGPEIGSPSVSSCDGMFLNKADEICEGDVACERAAMRAVMQLRRHPPADLFMGMSTHCLEGFCAAEFPINPSVIV